MMQSFECCPPLNYEYFELAQSSTACYIIFLHITIPLNSRQQKIDCQSHQPLFLRPNTKHFCPALPYAYCYTTQTQEYTQHELIYLLILHVTRHTVSLHVYFVIVIHPSTSPDLILLLLALHNTFSYPTSVTHCTPSVSGKALTLTPGRLLPSVFFLSS
jgi:hypothetical protein